MSIFEQDQQQDKLERVRQFIKDNGSYFSIDKTDFKRGKFYASGSGWQGDLGKAWGEGRANAHIDIVSPICDSTVNTFVRNPFAFSGLDETMASRINEVLAECLRETCQDGLSFCYIYHTDDGSLKIKRLSNLHVMYAETECIVIDKKKAEPGAAKSSIWNNVDCLSLATDEIPVITHFLYKDGIVEVSKIEDESIVAQTEIPLPRLPIIPIRGRQVFLSDNQSHYRGYYFSLRHLCSAISANLSVSLERMICRDPVILPEESLGSSEYIKQWEENGTRNFYLYKSIREPSALGESPMQLAPPMLNPQINDITKLETMRESLVALVDRVTGSNYASENKGNETATAVLLRNQHKEDALSQILLNMANAAKRIANTVEAYMAVLGVQIEGGISVTDNVSRGLKNTNAIQLLLSIKDLPLRLQLSVLQTYDAPPEILNAVALELQDQQDPRIQELEQQKQDIAAELQALKNENKMAEATHSAALISAEQRHTAKMAELTEDREFKMRQVETERMKLELDKAKLELEYLKLGVKKEIDLLKIGQANIGDNYGNQQ